MFLLILASLFLTLASSAIINFERIGGIPVLNSPDVMAKNADLLNLTFQSLNPGDRFIIPNKTFHTLGGIYAQNLYNVTVVLDGTLFFSNDRDTWPKTPNGSVMECFMFEDIEKVTFTSTGKGTLNGNGYKWWGSIKFLKHQEDRPRLFHIRRSREILFENILLKNSPFWTFFAEGSDGLVVRHSEVDARFTPFDNHTAIDLQAYNTDGFDVTGRNVYMHDLWIWNQDDCISVKDGSEDMFFERIFCSGLGLVIGSIGSSRVNNITFRDSTLYNTVKGIYMKTRWNDHAPIGDSASISNILYENITIDGAQQWAIWIGPAQQTGQPCSLLWPEVPGTVCRMTGYQTWSNITLKDVTVSRAKYSPGVLLGNSTNPMKNIRFENVVYTDLNPTAWPWQDQFFCEDGQMDAVAVGSTYPVPHCFRSERV